jgi:hypothetical protein
MVESLYCIGAFAPVDDKKIADVDLYVRGIFLRGIRLFDARECHQWIQTIRN